MTDSPAAPARRSFVIALGGNVIIPAGRAGTYDEQVELTRGTMTQVAELAAAGHHLVLTHGNGPVVGNIVLRNDAGWEKHGIPRMPLHVCGADSQGGIGYMIQQALQNALSARGLQRSAASVITQVVVDPEDPAFARPSKPIGPFYTAQQADALRRENGWTIIEDANRGYRRVVASPPPLAVVEAEAIAALSAAGIITIAAGGGGIPVCRRPDGELAGVAAVIDKDRASALLGRLIGADTLVIITQVDRVYRDFGKPGATAFAVLRQVEAAELLAAGEFPAGSMGPKIEAAISFLSGGGREVVITDCASILQAIAGAAGTRIIP